jgi:hypothetical protein
MKSTPKPGDDGLKVVRQAIIDRLCARFAEDGLSMQDFERRLDLAHGATSTRELASLVADFAPAPAPPPLRKQDAVAAASPTGPGVRARTVPREMVPNRQFMTGVLGASTRAGPWIVPRETYAVAVMGGVELDFREARFGPGLTELTALALWGGVEIIVPPGLQVECSGAGILGGFVHQRDQLSEASAGSGDPRSPVLRVNGVALMGGVNVSARLPGESERDAARRRKLARKARRKELRGW